MERYGILSDTTIPTTETDREESRGFAEAEGLSAILAAHVPDSSVVVDRCIIGDRMTIGRGKDCDYPILDQKLSKQHAEIRVGEDGAWIEDLGSTNGTYVQGEPLEGRTRLADGTVIRVGSSVLVYHSDAGRVMQATGLESYGFVGPFHTAALVMDLKEATASRRHLLITGPSGSGKELAARAVAKMLGKTVRVHNAARFTSEEEAMSTLFGVGRGVFSNVDARPGLIEQAKDNVLFLDEIHNLPERVQRGLLRIVEDAEHERIGDSKSNSRIDLRFVLASNAPGPFHGLAKDLYARLQKVVLPGLAERVADVPALFKHLLIQVGESYGVDGCSISKKLSTDHFEALCLGDYTDSNVRDLVDIADRLMVKVVSWGDEDAALRKVFTERFGGSATAFRSVRKIEDAVGASDTAVVQQLTTRRDLPEDHLILDPSERRQKVLSAYRRTRGNVTAIKRLLDEEGLMLSWKWISSTLDELGLPRIRKG